MKSWPDYCNHKYQLWKEGVTHNEYHCVKCGTGYTIPVNEWGTETIKTIQQGKINAD